MTKKNLSAQDSYAFKARLWKHSGSSGWHFLTLPKKISQEIRKTHIGSEEGWGRLKCTTSIGDSVWPTSVWYDSKRGSYLLPVKSVVRTSENLKEGEMISAAVHIERERRFF